MDREGAGKLPFRLIRDGACNCLASVSGVSRVTKKARSNPRL
ncbi:hypothetical protein CSIRO_3700 [Bradyrhizobiaceae bacterium SG-6C]|nr:hypothetical protein CSIRO_3700 [Bradyrhizobiaceae bacterium SG-6C]